MKGMNQHFGKETGTQSCKPSNGEPALTAGNQGSVGGSNQNSQTANEEQINKSLSSHSSLNHIYVPMEQQHCRSRVGGCERGSVWGVPKQQGCVRGGSGCAGGGRGASPRVPSRSPTFGGNAQSATTPCSKSTEVSAPRLVCIQICQG